MTLKNRQKNRNPWAWIPSLYFAEGIPYVVVVTVSVIMYKRLGISNTDITLYTSWLYLPWVIKPFWSPFVDLFKTKRWWVVTMQLFIGAGLAGVAFTLPLPFFFQASLSILWLMAFSSATHDIAADGFYMLALDSSQQSFFVGIRSTFYRLAMITGQGLLIIMAGALETGTGTKPVDFKVETINQMSSALFVPKNNQAIGDTNEYLFTANPTVLKLQIQNISSDSAAKIKTWAKSENLKNGFVMPNDKKEKEKPSWWKIHVSEPLGKFIESHFGETKPIENESVNKSGNIGLVAIHLNKKPENEEDMILNFRMKEGDKSIQLTEGEQLIFNTKNWNKTAWVAIQLDSKLKTKATSIYRGTSGNIQLAWSITFFVLAGLFVLLFLYHGVILPHPSTDQAIKTSGTKEILKEFGLTLVSFFRKKYIGLTLAFLLLYRLSEAMLVKMISPFLLDGREIGGMGLSTGQVGLVYGTVGIIALTLGGILGGIAASRKGLKTMIWPMALSITLPNFIYLYFAWALPDNFLIINMGVAIEQFGYGFGFTAFMLYMIYFADGKNKTAHFAICTGFMALGMMLPGMIAGWLQELIGYRNFFIFIMICTIPTLMLIPFMKIDSEFGKKKAVEKI